MRVHHLFGNRVNRNPNRVLIADTTLRDGAQTTGVAFTPKQRLDIARALAAIGVDVIEAGFPISSRGNARSVRAIAERVGKGRWAPEIMAFARTLPDDIDAAVTAVSPATHPRIHIVGGASDIHLKHKYGGRSHEENIGVVLDSIRHAQKRIRQAGLKGKAQIQLGLEDCPRANRGYLIKLLEKASKLGVRIFNIADTVGVATPFEVSRMFHDLRNSTIPKTVLWSFHGHNDLGLVQGNVASALETGARQFEVTVNGLGERTGNAELAATAALVREKFPDLFSEIKLNRLPFMARLISRITGRPVPLNQPITGGDVNNHVGGIHHSAVMKNPMVYEPFPPETYGRQRAFPLGVQSGRAGFSHSLHRLGFGFPDDKKAQARLFAEFKKLADKSGTVSDDQLKVFAKKQGLRKSRNKN